jgi:hypothetical protein
MSYIRSGSNPEGLYVFQSSEGLEFYTSKTTSADNRILVSPKDFQHFIKKIIKLNNYIIEKPIKYKNISIKEVNVSIHKKTRKLKIWNKEPSFRTMFGTLKRDSKYEWRNLHCLTIGGKNILMYKVTWDYFYNNYANQELFNDRRV